MCTADFQRKKYWPVVEKFFSELPPQLFQQATLLKNDLAIKYSDSGQFNDILTQPQAHPLLKLHFWLLQDLNVPDTPRRNELEKHLFLASTFAFASVHLHETILDSGSGFNSNHLFFAQLLTRQADYHLEQLYPGTASFWTYHRAYWLEHAEASLIKNSNTCDYPQKPEDKDNHKLQNQPWAFAKIPLAAVAIDTKNEAMLPRLCRMMERLNFILQTRSQISAIRRDAMRLHYTYPILRAMQAAKIDPRQPVEPERILGALLLTGTIEQICQECLVQLNVCKEVATAFHLPTFAKYFNGVKELLNDLLVLFSLKSKPAGQTQKAPTRRLFFTPYVDSLAVAIKSARDYLLADLTFRDSWEVQRGLVPDTATLTAKAFPSGLIIETLCRCGHNLPAQINNVFTLLNASNFRYYENYPQLPPDADDLGLLLRLSKYSAAEAQKRHRNMVSIPLEWMKAGIHPSGEIPVWFNTNQKPDNEQLSVLVWGNSCATTETNLLLGLIDFDWESYCGIIEKSTLSILDRFLNNGLGAALYYVPPYVLWSAFRLIAQLSTRSTDRVMRNKIAQTVALFQKRFQLETNRSLILPQDAALFLLAGLIHPGGEIIDSRWVTTLLKNQRHDGSWRGEPLFLVPHRLGTAWYAGRSVTTALCYNALKAYSDTE